MQAMPRCDEVGALGDVKPTTTGLFVVNIGKLGATAECSVRDDAGGKHIGDLRRPADCRWPAHVVGVFDQIEEAPWRSIEQGLVDDDPAKVIAAASQDPGTQVLQRILASPKVVVAFEPNVHGRITSFAFDLLQSTKQTVETKAPIFRQ